MSRLPPHLRRAVHAHAEVDDTLSLALAAEWRWHRGERAAADGAAVAGAPPPSAAWHPLHTRTLAEEAAEKSGGDGVDDASLIRMLRAAVRSWRPPAHIARWVRQHDVEADEGPGKAYRGFGGFGGKRKAGLTDEGYHRRRTAASDSEAEVDAIPAQRRRLHREARASWSEHWDFIRTGGPKAAPEAASRILRSGKGGVAGIPYLHPDGEAAGAAADEERYIVVLHPVPDTEQDVLIDELLQRDGDAGAPQFHARVAGDVRRAMHAVVADLSNAALDFVRSRPEVAWVETDSWVSVSLPASRSAQVVPTATQYTGSSNGAFGLDRLDQLDLPLDDSYTYGTDGTGVDVYVIDTGVLFDHVEFEGRASPGWFPTALDSATDCDGHGTHVAGTVGGAEFGVAKNVNIVGVRVLACDGTGSNADVIEGVDWAAETSAASDRKGVINMSLGGGYSAALNSAVAGAVEMGVPVVVAAGNEDEDSCDSSPASSPAAITVAASDSSDAAASFTNWGECVDIVAPGVRIGSAYIDSSNPSNLNEYARLSGTSMASPMVAGAMARLLEQDGTLTASEAKVALLCQATPGRISGLESGTPNRLIHYPEGGVSIVDTCDALSCADPDCNHAGECSPEGMCICDCWAFGVSCTVAATPTLIEGDSGAVAGDTSEAESFLGPAAGDAFFELTLPSGASDLYITLCDLQTNFDTVLFVLDTCPSSGLSYSAVLGSSDDAASAACPSELHAAPYTPSAVNLSDVPPGKYYIYVDGYAAEDVGTFGLRWEIEEIDHCASSPCLNGGTCIDLVGSYQCDCPEFYSGERCETQQSVCEAFPCENGGTCIPHSSGSSRECECPSGYDGDSCETNVDACQSVTCMNGGTCIGAGECVCACGFYGDSCENGAALVELAPVAGGRLEGTTVGAPQLLGREGGDVYFLLDLSNEPESLRVLLTLCDTVTDYDTFLHLLDACPSSSTWPSSEVAFSDDASPAFCSVSRHSAPYTPSRISRELDPAVYFVWVEGYADDEGSFGLRWEAPVRDSCAGSPCQNGGTCVDEEGTGFSCDCPNDFGGSTCEIDLTPCEPNPCHGSATCSDDGQGSFACNCPAHYTGSLCDVAMAPCESADCGSGTCHNSGSDYYCECPLGYVDGGHHCDVVDHCASEPCQNGGTCSNNGVDSSHECSCPDTYTGDNCETEVDECLTRGDECQNGSVCVDQLGDISCDCLPGWRGDFCGEFEHETAIRFTNSSGGALLGSIVAVEGGPHAVYFVSLTAVPTSAVVIQFSAFPDDQISIDPSSLVFGEDDWSAPQMITATAVEDKMDESVDDVEVSVTHVLHSVQPSFDDQQIQFPVVARDTDVASLSAAHDIVRLEEGSSSTVELSLGSKPLSPVRIDLVVPTGPLTQRINLPAAGPVVLPSEWDSVILIEVASFDNEVDSGITTRGNISFVAVSDDPFVDGLAVSLEVELLEDDRAGMWASASALSLTEGQNTSYTFVLTSKPTTALVVDVTVLEAGLAADVILHPSNLTFLPESWDTAQKIRVTASQDSVDEDQMEKLTLIHILRDSADPVYGELDDVVPVDVTVIDDDVIDVLFTRSAYQSVEEGSEIQLGIVSLASVPSTAVTVSVASSAAVTFRPSTLVFEASTWNVGQSIAVIAIDDDVDDDVDEILATVSLSTTSVSEEWVLTNVLTATVTIVDDDEAGVVLDLATNVVHEGDNGSNATLSLQLSSAPLSRVVARLSSAPGVAVAPRFVEFEEHNWNAPVHASVAAVVDDVAFGQRDGWVRVECSSADLSYNASSASVRVTTVDDDEAGVIAVPSGLHLVEGEESGHSSIMVEVRLKSQPLGAVDVTAVYGTGVRALPPSLHFTPAVWSVPQYVEVVSVDDDIDDGEHKVVAMALFSASIDPNYEASSEVVEFAVFVADDDVAGVTTSTIGKEDLDESRTTHPVTVFVTLGSRPVHPVEVVFSPSIGLQVEAPVVIQPSEWRSATAIEVYPVDDAIDNGAGKVVSLHAVTSSTDPLYNDVALPMVQLFVADNDVSQVVLPSSLVEVGEGDGAGVSFSVQLATAPLAPVTIHLRSPPQLVLSESELLIANWEVPVDVTVAAVDDNIDDGARKSLSITVSSESDDAAYVFTTAGEVAVDVIDDDGAGVTAAFSPESGTEVVEADPSMTVSFVIALDSQPVAEVIVIARAEGCAVISPETASILPSTWHVPVVFSATAVDDAVDDGDSKDCAILVEARSDDTAYDLPVSASLHVSVIDNDSAGIAVSPASITVLEADESAAVLVHMQLTSRPKNPVLLELYDYTGVSVMPASVLVDPTNWSTAVAFEISADDDAVDDGEGKTVTVAVSAQSEDIQYNIPLAASVTVFVDDNDVAALSVETNGPLVVHEGSAPSTRSAGAMFAVRLATKPADEVTVTIAPEAGLLANTPTLVFHEGNWDEGGVVQLFADDDDFDDGDGRSLTTTLSSSSVDKHYDVGNFEILVVSVVDNDDAGLSITPTDGTIVHESAISPLSAQVVLTARPQAPVSVSFVAADGVTVSPLHLLFDPTKWSVPLAVEVLAVPDDVDVGDSKDIAIEAVASSADVLFTGISATLGITVVDDDVADLRSDPTHVALSEITLMTATLSVVITSQPTDSVTVAISGGDAVVVAPPALVFNEQDWRVEQSVSLAAVDDDVDDGEVKFVNVVLSAASSDAQYDGLVRQVKASIEDNDDAGFETDVAQAELAEGGDSETVHVRLTSKPTSNVTASFSSSGLQAVPAQVVFGAANWSTWAYISVSAIDDDVDDGASKEVVLDVASSSDDAMYSFSSRNILTVAVEDNDVAGLRSSVSSVQVTEAADQAVEYAISLATRPTSDVTVGTVTVDATQVIVAPDKVTIGVLDWRTGARFSVRAVADGGDNEERVLHTSVIHQALSLDTFYNVTEVEIDVGIIDEAVDNCAPLPCLNGGRCVDGFAEYVCICAAGFEGENCEMAVPDVDCVVSEWSNAGDCDVACGVGAATRSREVINPAAGDGAECPALVGSVACGSPNGTCGGPTADCILSPWSPWSICSASCGPGQQTRTRFVLEPAQGSGACPARTESRACQVATCPVPVPCAVSPWSDFGACTCSTGATTAMKARTRTITVEPSHGGATCPALKEAVACEGHECTASDVPCIVSEWGEYSPCSGGVRVRERTIVQQAQGNGEACGDLVEVDRSFCPVDCVVDSFSEWSDCSVPCGGGGLRFRNRNVVVQRLRGGQPCPELSQVEECGDEPCAVHCEVGAWSAFSDCSATCGGGTRSRTRKLLLPGQATPHGGGCALDLAEQGSCNDFVCPARSALECPFCFGGTTGPCATASFVCFEGTQSTSGSLMCPGASAPCDVSDGAPQPCVPSTWSEWSPCSASCGGGARFRRREIVTPAEPGGDTGDCEALVQTEPCSELQCGADTDCVHTPWSSWSGCNADCGTGEARRARSVAMPKQGNGSPCGALEQVRPCDTGVSCGPAPSAIDCVTNSWSSFTACSATCGGGIARRTRSVLVAASAGGQSCGPLQEDVECNTHECVPDIDCVWDDWSMWSECDAPAVAENKCYDGEDRARVGWQLRTRSVAVPRSGNGGSCEGANLESRTCAAVSRDGELGGESVRCGDSAQCDACWPGTFGECRNHDAEGAAAGCFEIGADGLCPGGTQRCADRDEHGSNHELHCTMVVQLSGDIQDIASVQGRARLRLALATALLDGGLEDVTPEWIVIGAFRLGNDGTRRVLLDETTNTDAQNKDLGIDFLLVVPGTLPESAASSAATVVNEAFETGGVAAAMERTGLPLDTSQSAVSLSNVDVQAGGLRRATDGEASSGGPGTIAGQDAVGNVVEQPLDTGEGMSSIATAALIASGILVLSVAAVFGWNAATRRKDKTLVIPVGSDVTATLASPIASRRRVVDAESPASPVTAPARGGSRPGIDWRPASGSSRVRPAAGSVGSISSHAELRSVERPSSTPPGWVDESSSEGPQ